MVVVRSGEGLFEGSTFRNNFLNAFVNLRGLSHEPVMVFLVFRPRQMQVIDSRYAMQSPLNSIPRWTSRGPVFFRFLSLNIHAKTNTKERNKHMMATLNTQYPTDHTSHSGETLRIARNMR
jgi:hypothetical protein